MSMGKAMNLARGMKAKSMNQGGTCYACGGQIGMSHGGQVSEEELLNSQPEGGYAEEWNEENAPDWGEFSMSEGGTVGETIPDEDRDDLTYSPEASASDFTEDDEEDDGQDDENKNNFAKAFMISKKMRR